MKASLIHRNTFQIYRDAKKNSKTGIRRLDSNPGHRIRGPVSNRSTSLLIPALGGTARETRGNEKRGMGYSCPSNAGLEIRDRLVLSVHSFIHLLVGCPRSYHLVPLQSYASNKAEENGRVVSYWTAVPTVPGSNPYSPTPCFIFFPLTLCPSLVWLGIRRPFLVRAGLALLLLQQQEKARFTSSQMKTSV